MIDSKQHSRENTLGKNALHCNDGRVKSATFRVAGTSFFYKSKELQNMKQFDLNTTLVKTKRVWKCT